MNYYYYICTDINRAFYVLVSMGSIEVDCSSVVVSFLLPEQAGLDDEAHD